jgi:hypothetical protein
MNGRDLTNPTKDPPREPAAFTVHRQGERKRKARFVAAVSRIMCTGGLHSEVAPRALH